LSRLRGLSRGAGRNATKEELDAAFATADQIVVDGDDSLLSYAVSKASDHAPLWGSFAELHNARGPLDAGLQIAFMCGPGASETRYGARRVDGGSSTRISARLCWGAGRIHMGAGFGVQPPPAHAFRRTAAHVFDLLAVRMPAHTSDAAIRGIWPSQALGRGTVQISPGDHMPFLIGSKAGRSR
jgi:hypothetical protein